MGTALAYAMKALAMAPQLVSLGMDLMGHVKQTNAVLERAQAAGGDPTPEEWAALDAQAADLHARIQAA